MPKISVIVPVYKAEPFLRRCLDSVLSQTFPDFEIILIDDGSPDGSGLICDEYAAKDRRVRVIHQKNKGVSSARNAGLDIACGEYVTFLDSDDYLKPEFLQRLIAEDADFIIQNADCLNDAGKQLNFHVIENFRTSALSIGDVYRLSLNDSIGFTWGKALKLSIIRNNGIQFKTFLDFGEDTVFMAEYALKCSSIIVENIKNYCYIKYNERSTLSRRKQNIMLEKVKKANRVLSDIFADFNSQCAEELYYERIKPCYFFYIDEEFEVSFRGIIKNMTVFLKLREDSDWETCCRKYGAKYFPDYLQKAILKKNKVCIFFMGALYTFKRLLYFAKHRSDVPIETVK